MADTAPRARRPGSPGAKPAAAPRARPKPLVDSPDARPFIIWTLRRTGGTTLAQRLFKAVPFPIVEHEPFNGDRIFGATSALWVPGKNVPENERRRRLAETLATRPLIKHCVELFGEGFNQALAEETSRLGYRHLFLYRRQQADRLLSLHVARTTGYWGTRKESGTAPLPTMPPLSVAEQLAHARQCNRLLRVAWDTLERVGAARHMLAFEDIYLDADAAAVKARLHAVCGFLLEGALHDGGQTLDRIVDELTPARRGGERASPYESTVGMAALRQEMHWQPGFEPSRPRQVFAAPKAPPVDDDPDTPVPGLWLAPWSVGLRWCPTGSSPAMLLAVQSLVCGPAEDSAPRPAPLALEAEFAARETDIRHARQRIGVVGHPVRRFVAGYARVTLAAKLLSPKRLDALAAREPRLAGVLATLPRNPTLAEFVEFFRGYLKVPEVARHFVTARQHLGPLSQYDRIVPEEQIGGWLRELAQTAGRTLTWPVRMPAPPRIPAEQRDDHTLQRIRELCADDLTLLQPWYGTAARTEALAELPTPAHSDAE